MSVHKYKTGKGERWVVRWRENGKQLSRGGFRRKGDAQRWEQNNITAPRIAGEPTPGAGDALTVAQLADKYFEEALGAGHSKATADGYYHTYSAQVHDRIGGNTLEALTANTVIIDAWLATMNREQVSGASIRRAVAVLSAMCSYGQRQGLIRRNPCLGLVLPRVDSTSAVMLSSLAVELLARELESGPARKGARRRSDLDKARDALMVRTIAWCGCRPPSELLALRWEDVKPKTLRVDERLYDGEIEPRVKRGSGRSIPLQPFMAAEFARVKKIANPKSGKDLIFPASVNGEPYGASLTRSWRRNRFTKAMQTVADRYPETAELFEDATPYSARHHFVSASLAAGVPIFTVAQNAGTSTAMIEATYGHVIAELHDSPAVSLEDQHQAALQDLSGFPLS